MQGRSRSAESGTRRNRWQRLRDPTGSKSYYLLRLSSGGDPAFCNTPLQREQYAMKLFTQLTVGAALLMLAVANIAAAAEPIAVGRYTSPVKSFSTNSYWIAGKESSVLIDAQFLPNDAIAALEMAERASLLKVKHAFVLHPNPDKFNGTAALQQRGIKVLTSAQVLKEIPAVHTIRLGWFADEYKPQYPQIAAVPSVFGESSQTLNIDGITIKLHVLGRGCSAAHVVAQVDDAVFVGDLINPENHAWLELGFIDDWLARLDEIRALNPKRIFPGRGAPGGMELLDQQAQYLRYVQLAVRDEKPEGKLGWLTKLRLQRNIEARFPNLGYPIFMRDGLSAVWQHEATKSSSH
jgi:glyoxylase-like metal-dependent hydrolase (beta-lactamase superfamily II)